MPAKKLSELPAFVFVQNHYVSLLIPWSERFQLWCHNDDTCHKEFFFLMTVKRLSFATDLKK